MADYFGIPGTYSGTAQQMLNPSNTSYRVYQCHFSVTATTTPASAFMYLCDVRGTATTTASPNTTIYVTVPYDGDKPTGVGNWEAHEGVYFPNGVFIQTPSNLVFYTLVYSAISPNL